MNEVTFNGALSSYLSLLIILSGRTVHYSYNFVARWHTIIEVRQDNCLCSLELLPEFAFVLSNVDLSSVFLVSKRTWFCGLEL